MIQIKSLAALGLTWATLAATQDIDSNDVPSQCASVCSPVVSLTQQCDNDDGDSQYLNCVCNSSDASCHIGLCASCFSQYDSKGDDNDVHDIQSKCSFSSTSFNAMATSSAVCGTSSSSGSMSVTSSTSVVTTTDSAGSTTASTSATTVAATMSSAASPSQQTNAAAAGAVGKGLGVVAGVAGLAGLL